MCKKIHWLLILQSGFWLNSYSVREIVRKTRPIYCFFVGLMPSRMVFEKMFFCFRGMFDNRVKLSKSFRLILEESVD